MDEPPQELREGIFLPDIDKISGQWQAVLKEQSAVWQAKFDHLSGQIDALLAEVRSIKGVHVVIDRGGDAQ